VAGRTRTAIVHRDASPSPDQTPRRRGVDTLALHLRGVVASSPGGTFRTRTYSRNLSGSSWVNLPQCISAQRDMMNLKGGFFCF
jgi:hypothetical protein